MTPEARTPRPHPFIALEGTDGSGKSTLRGHLADALRAYGVTPVELGQHSWLHVKAARFIVGNRLARAHAEPEVVVRAYLRDKALHYSNSVLPALEQGPVLADRYVLSDVVYHHVLHRVPMSQICSLLNDEGVPLPDVIVFVDTPPAQAWSRINSRAKQLRPYEKPEIIADLYKAYTTALEQKLLATSTIRYSNDSVLDSERIRSLAEQIMVGWQSGRSRPEQAVQG